MKKFNFYLGTSVSAWLLTILVIVAELSGVFKSLLTTIFNHHWIGKAIIVTFVFVAFGYLLREKNSIGKFQDNDVAWYSVLGSLIAIFLFYTIEFFI